MKGVSVKRNVLGVFVIAGLLLASFGAAATVDAKKNNSNVRPGWGHGDKNHVHTGPPGKSVRP